MTLVDLLEWQWSDYAQKHRNRTNLLIHILAVPLFVLASLSLLGALLRLAILNALVAGALLGLSLFLQGKGHALEKSAPVPSQGGADFLRRILAEQFITFPRFVVSGGWRRNLASEPR
jgi:hypothetical protein